MQQVEAAGIGTPAAELPGGHEVQRLEAQIDAARGYTAEDELVTAVFDFWAAMCRTGNVKLGPKRVKKVQERLRDRPPTMPAEFFRAIVGAAFEPFSRGDKLYNDLSVICKDETILDIFVQRYFDVPDVRKFINEVGGDKAKTAATALMDLQRRTDGRSIDRKPQADEAADA